MEIHFRNRSSVRETYKALRPFFGRVIRHFQIIFFEGMLNPSFKLTNQNSGSIGDQY